VNSCSIAFRIKSYFIVLNNVSKKGKLLLHMSRELDPAMSANGKREYPTRIISWKECILQKFEDSFLSLY
jgi:hypothetical protein